MNIPTLGDIGTERKHVEIPAEVPAEQPHTAPAVPSEPVPA